MGESKSARLRLLPHDIRGEFRDEQIEQIKSEVEAAFAERIGTAKSRGEKRALGKAMNAEIARRTETLRREADRDTSDCV